MIGRNLDVINWTPHRVHDWLIGLTDENCCCLDIKTLLDNKICGKQLLLLTPSDIHDLGATKVNMIETIMTGIEKLRFHSTNLNHYTLQILILHLACQARELQHKLANSQTKLIQTSTHATKKTSRHSSLTHGLKDSCYNQENEKQKVSLEFLDAISDIVSTVVQITNMINRTQTKNTDLRSTKSLILALSIELSSTAQRDQFVERPLEILEKSSKSLADLCDRVVHKPVDLTMIQAYCLELITLKKNFNDANFGITLKTDYYHRIQKITPLSPAGRAINLKEGDEIVEINGRNIISWTEKSVASLMAETETLLEAIFIVKTIPQD